jgi:hypothetical protein
MSIVDDFIEFEINEYTTNVLLNAVEKNKLNPSLVMDEINFNMYNVILDFKQKTVTIQDEFDHSEKGEITMSIEEFFGKIL